MSRSYLIYPAFLLLSALASCSTSLKVVLPKDVPIVTRKEWGSAKPVLPMKKHVPQQITIHHTATKQVADRPIGEKLKALQKFSMERSPLGDGRIKEPWADIPYHFYIAIDGTIGEGRQFQYAGDSNTPYDPTGHALIVLEGNFENEKVSEEQYKSLQSLVLSIARRYKIRSDKISGHKDNASTACPGADLYSKIPELKEIVSSAQKGN